MPETNDALELCQQLIRCQSLTPDDAGCQAIIKQQLNGLGFEFLSLDKNDVSNLLALRVIDPNKPLLLYVGHTDVVPTGDEKLWSYPPFAATISDDKLYGRGAADMKSSVAAFVLAVKEAITQDNINYNIGLAITSDEEGPAIDGCKHIAAYLQQKNININYCLVGEPSSDSKVGDTIKVGRRGSLHAKLTIIGKQGHIAYPEKAINPIHQSFAVLDALCQIEWDQGNDEFPPTSMQISNIHSGLGAKNVIPENLIADINFRFCPKSSVESLQQKLLQTLEQYNLRFEIEWQVSALPFASVAGKLRETAIAAIETATKHKPILSTAGGTSDGRFFAKPHTEIIELGVCNKTIHQIDEHINANDVYTLQAIYKQLIENIM